ncbi:hypothetical protein HK097_010565, partial [Rhizophlyctis rosea]
MSQDYDTLLSRANHRLTFLLTWSLQQCQTQGIISLFVQDLIPITPQAFNRQLAAGREIDLTRPIPGATED